MNDILTVVEHQEISVSEIRDIKNNTISYEDREVLFDVTYSNINNRDTFIVSNSGKNRVKTNSIIGSISLKTGLTLEILPKFARDDLSAESIKKHRKMFLNILKVSNEKDFISLSSQTSKTAEDEMPLINYLIELFTNELLNAIRTGIYLEYSKRVKNSSQIRGNILISKTIQNNIIDKSKVYISYNEYSSNNLLMQIFKSLAHILIQDKNISYQAKKNLYEIYSLLDKVELISLKKYHFNNIIFNRLNNKFETLYQQAEFIFNKYMPFSSSINSSPFWAVLFDMDYLFEKFCAYLLKKSNIEIEEQSKMECFSDNFRTLSTKADFIIRDKLKIINVADAKWKIISKHRPLYGLDAQNFWQLFSYMNLINYKEEIYGYFIVPKIYNEIDDEITFKPIKEGNKTIKILSIDFSLNFEELIERYRFKIEKNQLKLDIRVIKKEVIREEPKKVIKLQEEKKIEILEDIVEIQKEEEEEKEEFVFSVEELIDELEVLSNNQIYITDLALNQELDRFKNILYLKKVLSMNRESFKFLITKNLDITTLNLDNLELETIPKNILKLHNIQILTFRNNKIKIFEDTLFDLKKLENINISKNNITIIPDDIIKLKSLRTLILDKKIIKNNIEIIKKIIDIVTIKDEKYNDLKNYIIDTFILKEQEEIDRKKDIDEYYILAEESFETGDFNFALECLNSSVKQDKTTEKFREKIYNKIGRSLRDIIEEIKSIQEEIDTHHRTDIKKYIKNELNFNNYFNLNKIIDKTNSLDINSLEFVITYLEDYIELNLDSLLPKMNSLADTITSQLINTSSEKNNILDKNILSWKDTDTELTWEVKNKYNINQVYPWRKCFDHAKKLNHDKYAGYTDWRVPTIIELKTLHIHTTLNSFYIQIPLSNNITKDIYWSSTEYKVERQPNASVIHFKNIQEHEKHTFMTHSNSIRCVRGKLVIFKN